MERNLSENMSTDISGYPEQMSKDEAVEVAPLYKKVGKG